MNALETTVTGFGKVNIVKDVGFIFTKIVRVPVGYGVETSSGVIVMFDDPSDNDRIKVGDKITVTGEYYTNYSLVHAELLDVNVQKPMSFKGQSIAEEFGSFEKFGDYLKKKHKKNIKTVSVEEFPTYEELKARHNNS
jgi:hypothetical protein